jgi:glutathione S-transferase
MKLYFSPGACSLAPHIALREANLKFQLVRVNVAKRELQSGGDFSLINPLGYVPVLEFDDGEHLKEGPAILQFIADEAPGSALAPAAGTRARARLNAWLAFISSELHQSLGTLFNNTQIPESTRESVAVRLRGRLDWVTRELRGREFLVEDRYSVADIYLFNILTWLRHVGLSIADWPALVAHSQRVGTRAAVRAALRAEAEPA